MEPHLTFEFHLPSTLVATLFVLAQPSAEALVTIMAKLADSKLPLDLKDEDLDSQTSDLDDANMLTAAATTTENSTTNLETQTPTSRRR